MSDKKATKNETDDANMRFWQAIYEVLQDARQSLPYSTEPERVYWDHPDDDWKNDAEVQALEMDCSPDTDDLIRHYCHNKAWPKRSKNNCRYFAERRIAWALGILRLLTIPVGETTLAAIPRPPQSGWELLHWLLIDAYHQRFPPREKTPFYISGNDGATIEVWT